MFFWGACCWVFGVFVEGFGPFLFFLGSFLKVPKVEAGFGPENG